MPAATGGKPAHDGDRPAPDAPPRQGKPRRPQRNRELAPVLPYMARRRRPIMRAPDDPAENFGYAADSRDVRDRSRGSARTHGRRRRDLREKKQVKLGSWRHKTVLRAQRQQPLGPGSKSSASAVERRDYNFPLELTNRYGLPGKTYQKYPQLFQPSAAAFWGEITDTERQERVVAQARAMELVGYERGTQKFFIDEIELDTQVLGMVAQGERAELAGSDAEGGLEAALAETEYELRRKARQAFLKQRAEDRKHGRRQSYAHRSHDTGFNPLLSIPRIAALINRLGGATHDLRDGVFDEILLRKRIINQALMTDDTRYIPAPGSEGAGGISSEETRAKPAHTDEPKEDHKHMPEMWPGGGKPGGPTSGKHKLSGKAATGSGPTANRFGLTSRAQELYPEAFKPVDSKMWAGLSQDQREAVLKLQATAMERVGFEKGTSKFFIKDFDPADPDKPVINPQSSGPSETDLVALAAPRYFAGGVLVGGGAMVAVFGAISSLPTMPCVVGGILAVGIGLVFAMFNRS